MLSPSERLYLGTFCSLRVTWARYIKELHIQNCLRTRKVRVRISLSKHSFIILHKLTLPFLLWQTSLTPISRRICFPCYVFKAFTTLHVVVVSIWTADYDFLQDKRHFFFLFSWTPSAQHSSWPTESTQCLLCSIYSNSLFGQWPDMVSSMNFLRDLR